LLPVQGTDLGLGNDLASGKVEANPYVSDVSHSSICDPVDTVPGLFLAGAVTHAMAKRSLDKLSNDNEQLVEEVTVYSGTISSFLEFL